MQDPPVVSAEPIVLVIGDAAVDWLLRVDDYPPRGGNAWSPAPEMRPGGSGTNVAVNLARMGVAARFVGRLADDDAGNLIRADLEAEGVVLDGLPTERGGRTPVVVAVLDGAGERTLISASLGSAQWQLQRSDVGEAVWQSVAWLHASGICLAREPSRTAVLFALEEGRRRGISTSLDVNLRLDGNRLQAEVRQALMKAIALADLVVASRAEALALTGMATEEAALGKLQSPTRRVIVRLGAQGSIASDGSGPVRSSSYPATVVDQLGAGDAFDAGFIAASMDGQPLQGALRWANAAAALNVSGVGARAFHGLEALRRTLRDGAAAPG
ncbi:MAG: sugar kinase [Chloroflexi bacterium]|nr:sugar kinase [Chloroflexota bacterium]